MGLASRGLRDMDEGVEKITDEAELSAVRRQARAVPLRAAMTAVLLVALPMLLPT